MAEPTYDVTGDIPGGSTPPAPGQSAPQGTPPPAGATAGSDPGADPNAAGAMVPSYRLREVTERSGRIERALGEAIAHIRTLNEASSRAQTQPPPGGPAPRVYNDDIQTELKARLMAALEEHPFLGRLLKQNPDQFFKVLEQGPQMEAQTEHYWTNVGGGYLRSLQAQASKIFGPELDPFARRAIETGFIDWIENDPEAKRRYLATDPTLVEDYWKQYESRVLDPVRRKATVPAVERGERIRRLPSSGPSTQALGKGPPAKPKTEEELHDAAWNALEEIRRA